MQSEIISKWFNCLVESRSVYSVLPRSCLLSIPHYLVLARKGMMEQIACSKLVALDAAITTKFSSTPFNSNSNKKITVTEQEDRLSALPDAILHHILSFLDMQEVVNKSILSKRWRYLWTSVPCLNFNHYRWEKITTKRKDKRMLKNGFMNFVDRVLFLRDASNISKMVLSCENFCDAQRVDAWLTIAARRHVKEIQLKWIPGIEPAKQLSHFIFTAPITVFDLKLSSDYGTVQLPYSMCSAPHLKTLKLKYAKLPKGNSTGELLLTCPVLENLAIIACQHGEISILSINTPRLRNLVVTNVVQLSGNWTNGSCKIKICTPDLESLKISGILYQQHSVELISSSLLTAEVYYPVPVVPTQSLVNILSGIRRAKSVILSGLELEPQNEMDRSLIVFENLKCLKLTGCPNVRCLSDLLHLLRNSPCIETLAIEAYQMKEMLDWGTVLLPTTFFQVQNVEIGRFRGREDEYKFVEHLLKKAVSIKTLTIKFEQYGCNRECVLPKFGSRLTSLPRASSSSIAIVLI